jgi:hypothetical protein
MYDELPATEWRRLGPYLWAGSGERGPVGTVERGRRFVALDTNGDVRGRYKRLTDAQALLADLQDMGRPRRAA